MWSKIRSIEIDSDMITILPIDNDEPNLTNQQPIIDVFS